MNLDHFQILRAIGKGSFGKVRLRMGPGWTCVGKAGRLGLVERVGMLPAGQASDAGASGGLPLSPPLLSSPSPGLWVLVARLGAGGADGASLGSSGAKTPGHHPAPYSLGRSQRHLAPRPLPVSSPSRKLSPRGSTPSLRLQNLSFPLEESRSEGSVQICKRIATLKILDEQLNKNFG